MNPIASRLLDWYEANARDLPWRQSQDPYAIWVSEIMLQQTRVETVVPYYRRWMDKFPTVHELAQAELDEVLTLWEGLGYYRRARYLHEAAQQVVSHHGGQLPGQPRILRELPGVGEYTAAAISAFAYNNDSLALDGNLKRVLARIFKVELEVQTSEAKRLLRLKGEELLPAGRAADFNQALMDLGATICTPRSPACPSCPLAADCLAFRDGVQQQFPVRHSRGETPTVQRAAVALRRDDQVLVAQRPLDGLLGGLWEFPGVDLDADSTAEVQLRQMLAASFGLEAAHWHKQARFNHAYSHFRVEVELFIADWQSGELNPGKSGDRRWAEVGDLPDLAMGKVDRAIARTLVNSK
jgi:A/G-specific adenine glycosylase